MSLKGLFLAFVPIVPCSIGFLRLTLRLATDLAETSALAVGTSRAPGREVLLDTISRTWRTGEADPVWASLAVTAEALVATPEVLLEFQDVTGQILKVI